MKLRKLFIVLIIIIIPCIGYSQIYDYVLPKKKNGYFDIGFLTVNTTYPSRFNIPSFSQKGVMTGGTYKLRTLESVELGQVAIFDLNIEGGTNIGYASAQDDFYYNELKSPDTNFYSIAHHTGVLDLFTMSVKAEYTLKLPMDKALIADISITFFNIGGTFTYMDGGKYDKKMFGTFNFMPFYIRPSAKLVLKGATIGLGVFLNPYSLLEYRFGPEGFYSNKESGVQVNGTYITKYAVEAYLAW